MSKGHVYKERQVKLEEKYLRPKTVRERYGVSYLTLSRWAKAGKIRSIRVGESEFAAHRYHEEDLRRVFGQRSARKREEGEERDTILYARVSSAKQQHDGDLDRQIDQLEAHCPRYNRIITDVASGLNYQRRGLLALLDAVESGSVAKVMVTHKDRLARFGLDLLYRTFNKHDCELHVVSDEGDGSKDDELAQDLLAVCNYFVAKNNGRRAAAHARSRRIRSTKTSHDHIAKGQGNKATGRARADDEDQTSASDE